MPRQYRYTHEIQHWLLEDWSSIVHRGLLPSMRWVAITWHQGNLLTRDSVAWTHRWIHRKLRRWVVDPYEDQ